MKKLTYVLGILLLAGILHAQAPQSFKYQAIARNTDGTILSNQNISLRISIVLGIATGDAVYSEMHNVNTNDFGLINLVIGKGETISGKMSDISWGMNEHFVKIEIDAEGGDDYVVMGVSQLLSVPYALYAKTSGSLESGSSSSSKEAGSWTDGPNETWLTNPLFNVGIGTQMPAAKLHIIGTGTNAIFERSLNNIGGPTNRFYKSRGSTASKQAVEIGDYLGSFQYWGYTSDGTFNYGAILGSRIENVGASDVAGNFVFMTTDNSFNYAERMRITADGNVGIGTSIPADKLHIAGSIRMVDGNQGVGKVMVSDANGTGVWTAPASKSDGDWTISGSNMYSSVIGNVGIGSASPTEKLDVTGNIKASGTIQSGNSIVIDGVNDKITATGGTISFDDENLITTGSAEVGGFKLSASPSANHILVSDGSGVGSWTNPTSIGLVKRINDLSDGKTATYSVFLGAGAGYYNTTGSANVGVGVNAIRGIRTGIGNTACGHSTLYSNTSGNANTSVGYIALYSNTTGNDNTASGAYALHLNKTGDNNTAHGKWSLMGNIGGDNNTAIGAKSNRFNMNGSNNTIIGFEAGCGANPHNKSGNVFLGYQAGYNELGDNKLYIENSNANNPLIYGEFDNDILVVNGSLGIGTIAPANELHVAGNIRMVDGNQGAGKVMVSDADGTASWTAPASIDDGDWTVSGTDMYSTVTGNVGIGSGSPTEKLDVTGNIKASGTTEMSGFKLSTSPDTDYILVSDANGSGSWTEPTSIGLVKEINNLSDGKTDATSVFLGSGSGGIDNGNNNNVGVGIQALRYNSSGIFNTAIGYQSLTLNESGSQNTAAGYYALLNNLLGDGNTAIGVNAQMNNTNGNYNTTLGNGSNLFNVQGSENTIIGYEAGKGTTYHNKSGNIFLGYQAGYNETGNSRLYIENTNSTDPLIYGDFVKDSVSINGKLNATGIIQSGNSIVIDGTGTSEGTITESHGKISFDDETIVTTGNAAIGTNTPESSAQLEVSSNSKGFLPPRMSTNDMNNITNPATGLCVYNTSVNAICYYNGSSWDCTDPQSLFDKTFFCGDQLRDFRDGNTYTTIQIGDQCWMAKNLAYLPAVYDSTEESSQDPRYYVFRYSGSNVTDAKATYNYQTYGVLYNGVAATNGARSNSIPSGIQGVCPTGWHIPSNAEWSTLVTALGGESIAGGKMKETGTAHWESESSGTTNSSGFTALPGGSRSVFANGMFGGITERANFWSTTKPDGFPFHFLLYRILYHDSDQILQSHEVNRDGKSIRCLRD